MICHIQNRIFVRQSFIKDIKLIIFIKAVCHVYICRSRISLISIRAVQKKGKI